MSNKRRKIRRLASEASEWKAQFDNALRVLQLTRAAIGCPFDGTSIVEFGKKMRSKLDTIRSD